MRKFHKVVIAAAVAAGGLSAVGAGAGAAAADTYGGGPEVSDLYRPYQECSPQTVAENDVPLAVLGLAQTTDTTCGQYNNAFNAFAG